MAFSQTSTLAPQLSTLRPEPAVKSHKSPRASEMQNMDVPSGTTILDIYPKDAVSSQQKRWETLLEKFKNQYGRSAEFVSRSPGRVNLIGEHIDYSLYQVLPMAVTVDVLVAVAVHPTS